ncbi:hypothetical protein MKW92_006877 [Papaver armeniacum]|nr:hypothetical protein MKW92_006877 [Papaver armeniacum]
MSPHYYYHFVILLLLVFATTLLMLLLKPKAREGKWRQPPGPKSILLIGNLHQLGNGLPHISLQKLSNEYGPLMFLKLGSIPTLVVSSADMAKQILKTHDLAFSDRPMFYALRKLSYGCSDIAFSRYGVYWRQVRKIAILELLSAKRVLSYRAVREDEVASAIHFMRASSASSVPINLSEVLVCLTNNVICRVAFGMKHEAKQNNKGENTFYTMLQETQSLLAGFSTADLFPWMRWIHKFDGLNTRLQKNFRYMDEFFDKVIDEHINHGKLSKTGTKDFVDVLLRVQEDLSYGINLTRDNIKAIIMVR